MRIVRPLSFCSRGGIGRRVRLRTVWGNPWRFESSREQRYLLSRWRPINQLLQQKARTTGTAGGRFEWIYLPAPFLLAAHRAFINCESRFRPAGVIPPFFLAPKPFGVVFWPAFILAQRALAATASLDRVAADIPRPLRVARAVGELPRIEERRFCSVSICRRIETASCKA
jgi:hypothetical protein